MKHCLQCLVPNLATLLSSHKFVSCFSFLLSLAPHLLHSPHLHFLHYFFAVNRIALLTSCVMSFLAADPVIIRKALVAADKVSHLTNFSQAGRGPWDPKKDAQEQFDFVILGGTKQQGPTLIFPT